MKINIRKQLQSNFVALLSLAIALSALFYNTWRNERSELNRNLRTASFTVLKTLGELQVITDFAHYQRGDSRGNPITGWGYLLLIEDMSDLLPDQMQQDAHDLRQSWQNNWSSLGQSDDAEAEISRSIDNYRQDLKAFIAQLD